MYVAITRARKRLYLSHSQTRMLHGQTRYNVKSRFLTNCPKECLKWITPKQQGFGSYAPNSGAGGAYGSSARGQFGFKSETFASPHCPAKAAPSHGLRAGIAVFHTKFGEGKVLAIEGTGDDARPRSTSPPRHQMAGAEVCEVDGGGLISPAGATANGPCCVVFGNGRAGRVMLWPS